MKTETLTEAQTDAMPEVDPYQDIYKAVRSAIDTEDQSSLSEAIRAALAGALAHVVEDRVMDRAINAEINDGATVEEAMDLVYSAERSEALSKIVGRIMNAEGPLAQMSSLVDTATGVLDYISIMVQGGICEDCLCSP